MAADKMLRMWSHIKEVTQSLRDLHDPTIPENYCLVSPCFVNNKHVQENIRQYNLKHLTLTNKRPDKDSATIPPQQAIIHLLSVNSINTHHTPFLKNQKMKMKKS